MTSINVGLFLLGYADELEKLAAKSNGSIITEQVLTRNEKSKGFLVNLLREAGLSSILYGLVGAALGGMTGVGIGSALGDPMGGGLAGGALGAAAGSQVGALSGGMGAALQQGAAKPGQPGQSGKKPAQSQPKISNPSSKFGAKQPSSGGNKK